MSDFEIVISICLVIALVITIGISHILKKDEWVSTEEFQEQKYKLRARFTQEEFDSFMRFLYSYKGGYIKRKAGKIVSREYLAKEKGDLKGIFFNLVAPNPKLTTQQKEEFRAFIRSIGVTGVNKRPDYETRDNKLRNNKVDENEWRRKQVGNIGEMKVRKVLEPMNALHYSVINGAALQIDGEIKEYDHIVIGKTGIFCIETKAYGMTLGKTGKSSLYINNGDQWVLRKNYRNKEIISPTEQIMEEKEVLKKIVSCPTKVHAILALSNEELFMKKNIKLPYAVVGINELVHYMVYFPDELSDKAQKIVLEEIDQSRIN